MHAFGGDPLNVQSHSEHCTVGGLRALVLEEVLKQQQLDGKETRDWICEGTAFNTQTTLVLHESGLSITGLGHNEHGDFTVSGQQTERELRGPGGETKLVLTNQHGDWPMALHLVGNELIETAPPFWKRRKRAGHTLIVQAGFAIVLMCGELVLPDKLALKSLTSEDAITYALRSMQDVETHRSIRQESGDIALRTWYQHKSKAFVSDLSCCHLTSHLSDTLFDHQLALTVADSMLSNTTHTHEGRFVSVSEENLPGGISFKSELPWSLSARNGTIRWKVGDWCMQFDSVDQFAEYFASQSEQTVSYPFVCSTNSSISSIIAIKGTLLKRDLEQLAGQRLKRKR